VAEGAPAMYRLRSMTKVGRPAIVFLGTCVCVGLLVFALISAGSSSSKAHHTSRSSLVAQIGGPHSARRGHHSEAPMPPLNPAQPLGPGGSAHQMSLSNAHAAVSFPFPVPNTSTAGPGNLSAAWARSETGEQEVALLYGGTDVTIYVEPAPYSDPTAAYTALLGQYAADSVQASLGEVNGNVALIVAPSAPTVAQPTMVEFELNGVDIRVTSTTYGTAALMDIADNMAAQSSQ
jgi:hypothetical protein